MRCDDAATAADIVQCYRVFLGREPENDFVVEEKAGRPHREVVAAFVTSGEFAAQTVARVMQGLPPATALQAAAAPDAARDWAVARFGLGARDVPRSLIELLAAAIGDGDVHALLETHYGGDTTTRFAAALRDRAVRAMRGSAAADTALTLMCGPVLLGSLGRPPAAPGTVRADPDLWDHGLADFARLCGLDDFALVASSGDGATNVHPLPLPPIGTRREPLASRNRLGPGLRLADLWFASRRDLLLRFEGGGDGTILDAYQCAIGDTTPVRLVAGAAIDAAVSIAAIKLLNPYVPLLVVLRTPDGAIRGFDHIPFPSLARGGLHAAERMICGAGGDDVADMAMVSAALLADRLHPTTRSLAAIRLDAAAHLGTEPIFEPDLLDYLGRALGIAVCAPDDAEPWLREALTRIVPRDGAVLHLPADAVPTLSALIRSIPPDAAAQNVAGSAGLIGWDRQGAVRSLSMPPLGDWLARVQPRDAGAVVPMLAVPGATEGAALALAWPLAIRIAPPPVKMGSRPPFEITAEIDAPLLAADDAAPAALSVIVLIDATPASPLPLLESLARQRGATAVELLVCRSGGFVDPALADALGGLFPDRHTLIDVAPEDGRLGQLFAARARVTGDLVLIVDAATILTDPRTLATLATMLAPAEVATAGCLVRTVQGDRRIAAQGGYTLSHADLRSTPALGFAPLDLAALGMPTTLPVAANAMSALLLRRSLLDALPAQRSDAGRPAEDDLRLGLAALAHGVNLCTSAVSVHTDRPQPTAREFGIALPYRLDATMLGRLIDRTAVIRSVA